MDEQSKPNGGPRFAPVNVALIGAGIFMRDAHLPSILNRPDLLNVVAVYSRTAEAASALAAKLPGDVEIYTELDPLLAQPEVEAVDIALPIRVQPEVVRRALTAGKHVLSEKPIAPAHATARELMALNEARSGQVWMVGENLRYESAYPTAAALLRDGAIGKVRTCSWSVFAPMNAQSKYFGTGWRQAGDFPGGLLLDGGVHHVAVMRLLMGDVAQVSAMVQQVSPALPPADTLTATLRFASGAQGVYLASYAVDGRIAHPVTITGDEGAMFVYRDRIEVRRSDGVETISCPKFDGVENEMAAWVTAIRTGDDHRNTPLEALHDLLVIEAMLDSARGRNSVDVPTPISL